MLRIALLIPGVGLIGLKLTNRVKKRARIVSVLSFCISTFAILSADAFIIYMIVIVNLIMMWNGKGNSSRIARNPKLM